MTRKTRGPVALAAMALATLAFAGCLGDQGTNDTDAPVAALQADTDNATSSPATVTFDAQGSEDPNGEIDEYRFDFGDGQTMTVTEEDAARVEHTYEHGGVFHASVQVFDDGSGQAKVLTDNASVQIVLDQEYDLTVQPATAGPLENQTDTAAWEFTAYEGVDSFEANITLENTAIFGTSEVTVQVVDADGQAVTEEQVSVPEGEMIDVNLTGDLSGDGDHEVQVVADSGSISAYGELRVFYVA